MTADRLLRQTTQATLALLDDDVVTSAILTSDADNVHERLEAVRVALGKANAYAAGQDDGILRAPRRAISRVFGGR